MVSLLVTGIWSTAKTALVYALLAAAVVLAAILAWYALSYLPRLRRVEAIDARYPGIAKRLGERRYRILPCRAAGGNWYDLEFPSWAWQNADGSRDRRRNGNRIVWGTCTLYLDEYAVKCPDPGDMVALVKGLRSRGASVAMNELERDKAARLLEEAEFERSVSSAQAVVRRFDGRPTEFEGYCADIYRRLGCRAEGTPPTNDGGYDIALHDGFGTALVECKLYDASHKVGRPHLQKLVGANATRHADRLIFVTTSSFTAEAEEFARSCGVPFGLVDGEALVRLHEKHHGRAARRVGLDDVDWRLRWEDIEPYYPTDYCDGR